MGSVFRAFPLFEYYSTSRNFSFLMVYSVISMVTGQECKPPEFQGISMYLPFCSGGVTYNNACEAASQGSEPPVQGSCDQCEFPCFRKSFTPVCSADQSLFFPNECHAKCAGYEGVDLADCVLQYETVIPGKTKLPPNAPPLQGL